MPSRFLMRIPTRLTSPIGFSAMAIVGAVILAAVAVNVFLGYDTAINEQLREHELHGRLLAENVARSMDSVEVLVDDLKTNLNNSDWSSWQESRSGHKFLKSSLRVNLPQLRHLLIYDANGVQRFADFAVDFDPVVVTDRPYWGEFIVGAEQAHFGPYVGRNTGKLTYAVMRRLSLPDGRFGGMLMGTVEHSYFETFCQSVLPYPSFDGALVNRSGEIISRCRPPDPAAKATVIHFKDVLANGEFGLVGDLEADRVKVGRDHLLARFDVPGYSDLQVVTAVRKSEALSDWHKRLIQFLILSMLAGMVLFVATLLIRRQFKKLQRLMAELNESHNILESRVNDAVREVEQSRQTILRKEHYQSALLDNFPFMVWLKDTDSCFLAANQVVASKYGVADADSLIGRNDHDIAPREMADQFRSDDLVVMSSRQSKTVEEEIGIPERSSTVWVETYRAPVLDESGVLLGTVGFSRDITDRKLIETELIAAKQAAENANLAKSRFLAAASHDLRQPLQAISLFSEALGRSGLNDNQKNISAQLAQSALSLGDILNALLDISKLDSGMVKPKLMEIQSSELLHGMDSEFSRMAFEKGLRFKLRFPAGAMGVLTDPGLLASLLRNLVGNALKYTERGGVLVGIRRCKNKALIQVWDTGIGIAAEEIDNIFEEYYQLGNPARDKVKGLGLGLAIVRRLANLLGTHVVCRSRPGRGTVFEFGLPLSDKPVENAQDRTKADAGAGSGLVGRRIAVIEDNALVAYALRFSLESLGMVVNTFGSAEEALARSDITEYDFYISDFRLHGMNGVEFLDAISQRSTKPVKAVLLTGDTSPDRVEITQSSSWTVLFKPVDLSVLVSAIKLQDTLRK